MRILSKESFTVIQPLLRDNYANLYSRLILQLPREAAGCFAKFTMLTAYNSGQWSIECEGEDEYKPISAATAPQRMAAAAAFGNLRKQLQDSGMVADVERLLSVPDKSCIYFRQMPSGDVRLILTQWGYRRIGSAANINNVALMIGMLDDGMERCDVNLALKWSDDTPIADMPVKVGVYGTSFDRQTDADGLIKMGTVAVGERFTVDVEGHDTVALRTDANSDNYIVTLPWKVSATIRCVNTKKEPAQATVTINGRRHDSDAGGVCALTGIVLLREGALNVSLDGGHEQKFPLHRDSRLNDFTYVLPAPPEHEGDSEDTEDGDNMLPPPLNEDVCIRILDKRNRPLRYTTVKVEMRKGVRKAVTDEEGYIRIDRKCFTQGEKVKVRVLPEAATVKPAPAAPQPHRQTTAPAAPAAPVPPPIPHVQKKD